VHYKGATPALTDVVAGHIQMMFVSVGTAVPQWRSSKVKLIAVSSAKRMERLPDVPTVSETGVPGYEAVSWFGLFGPAGMPADVVAKINGEIRAMHAEPEFKKSFLDRFYFQSIAGPPERLVKFIKDEEPKWRKIITDAKIKVE
jgi:tripartite-type tricarboxylate transporter receptor subunit TctC